MSPAWRSETPSRITLAPDDRIRLVRDIAKDVVGRCLALHAGTEVRLYERVPDRDGHEVWTAWARLRGELALVYIDVEDDLEKM